MLTQKAIHDLIQRMTELNDLGYETAAQYAVCIGDTPDTASPN
jgi:hypothetical protein